MSDDIDLSIRQFTEAWRLMCTGVPGHAVATLDGVECIFSGCPISFFNVAVVTGRNISSDGLRSRAEQASAWAATRQVPWLLIVTHEALASGTDAASILDACGLGAMMPMTGMLARQVAPVAGLPEGLTLTVPHDDAACAAIVDVNALAYGMDLEAGKDLIGKRSFWVDQFPVVGMVDGKPVASTAVLMVDGHRYVALVATDPSQQRRGYADAAMRRALELAAGVHGERPTVLHATDAGRPVYERMGYAVISTHTIFMDKQLLGPH